MIAKQRTEAGFSLMEVMVALTILATTAVGVMQLSSGAISGTQQVEQRFLARTVASNQLAELYLNREPLRQGVTSGQETQLGQTFTWTRTVLPGPQEGLLLVEVSVSGDKGDGPLLAELATLRRPE